MPRGRPKLNLGSKSCIQCGKEISLKIKRDLLRKKFCCRSCCSKYNWETGKIIPHIITDETKEKMRKSKLALLKTGWKPTGWKKCLPKFRISHRGYKFWGTKREHTILAEQEIGRKLFPNEVVHHLDFNKLNNSLNNLVVLTRSEHSKLHLKERILSSQNHLLVA